MAKRKAKKKTEKKRDWSPASKAYAEKIIADADSVAKARRRARVVKGRKAAGVKTRKAVRKAMTTAQRAKARKKNTSPKKNRPRR